MAAVVTTHHVSVRLAQAEELPLIMDSWMRSYEKLMPLHVNHYGLGRREWSRKLAAHCTRTGLCFVAYVDDVPDIALGWACVAPPDVVHYVYVKHEARKMGIGRMLVRGCGLQERGVRMTARPGRGVRKVTDAAGWQWRPLTMGELK